MKTLMWLANSPDMNSIKNKWIILKVCVQWKSRPKNRKEMIKAILRAWEGVFQDILDMLISTMYCKMRVIIATTSDNTK
jgi:hypothetical protein